MYIPCTIKLVSVSNASKFLILPNLLNCIHYSEQHFTLSQLFLTSAEPGSSLATTVLPYSHNPRTVRKSPSCLCTVLPCLLYKNNSIIKTSFKLNSRQGLFNSVVSYNLLGGLCMFHMFIMYWVYIIKNYKMYAVSINKHAININKIII